MDIDELKVLLSDNNLENQLKVLDLFKEFAISREQSQKELEELKATNDRLLTENNKLFMRVTTVDKPQVTQEQKEPQLTNEELMDNLIAQLGGM